MAILAAVITGYLIGSIPVGVIVSRDRVAWTSANTAAARPVSRTSLGSWDCGDRYRSSWSISARASPRQCYPSCTRTTPGLARGRPGGSDRARVAVFAGFRGGRGVLTGAGVLVALDPLACLVVVPVALAVMVSTKYMSATSITGCAAAGVVFVVFAALGWHDWAYAAAAVAGGSLIVALHKDNIRRLRDGVEPKIGHGGERRATA